MVLTVFCKEETLFVDAKPVNSVFNATVLFQEFCHVMSTSSPNVTPPYLSQVIPCCPRCPEPSAFNCHPSPAAIVFDDHEYSLYSGFCRVTP
jgi:hypothetical protein